MSKPDRYARLRTALRAGDWANALKLASGLPQAGDQRKVIARAWEAHVRPELYRQMGQDPAGLIDAGIAAMHDRFPELCQRNASDKRRDLPKP
jgi:hypothetical protein